MWIAWEGELDGKPFVGKQPMVRARIDGASACLEAVAGSLHSDNAEVIGFLRMDFVRGKGEARMPGTRTEPVRAITCAVAPSR
jgi:hypothetical protein